MQDNRRKFRDNSMNNTRFDHDTCYRAIQARDSRFDGRFFSAVLTTGIYCRPTCPAPTPKQENCVFFTCAAAAQEAGFRPCLRCRPELAPHLYQQEEPAGIVARALQCIDEGLLDEQPLAVLAERFHITERHLRRLVVSEVGAPPTRIAQTRRILFAKQLIDETDLSFTDIALAAGFKSIRRFNHVMQKTYQRSPRDLRRGRVERPNGNHGPELRLRLAFTPPYDWDALISFYRKRAVAGLEVVTGDSYQRTISVESWHGVVKVQPVAGENYLLTTIHIPNVMALGQIVERLRRMFDLKANSEVITAQLGCDPLLERTIQAHPGIRVPGAWDPFEAGIRAILGQQISVQAARSLLGKLLAGCGEPLDAETQAGIAPELQFAFPSPAALAAADLSSLGIPRKRASALQTFAATMHDQPTFFQDLLSLEEIEQQLCALPGIGRWTAHYIAMRGLREPDSFPDSDLGLLQAAEQLSGHRLTAAQLRELAEPWRPWRAYAAVYLWLTHGQMINGGKK
jgi:AraC family transcriptional regulator of adaptative response / DNA-3-methyladenine glycosylase II